MLPNTAPIVTLGNMRGMVAAKNMSIPRLTRLTNLELKRLNDLASVNDRRTAEPTLAEAWIIARVLGTEGICPLIGDRLADIKLMEDPRGDLNVWRSGCDLPLSHGIRLAQRFGFSDPYDVHELLRLRARAPVLPAIWNMAPGEDGACGWCGSQAGYAHADDCLPDLLWGPRGADRVSAAFAAPGPRTPGKSQQGSFMAYGLAKLRRRLRKTQKEMAAELQISYSHYSKLDGRHVPMTYELARTVMDRYGVTIDDLATAPPPPPPAPRELADAPVHISADATSAPLTPEQLAAARAVI